MSGDPYAFKGADHHADGKIEERDELQGFDLGVDEYISKPFSPKILVARVEAILRRTQGSGNTDEISAGGIVVDKAAHTVMSDGSPVDLSFKEFELLTYFIENQGIALSREKILNNVWNYDYFGDARTIDTHVKKLRSKLGDKGEYIKTIWGMGYKFEVEYETFDQKADDRSIQRTDHFYSGHDVSRIFQVSGDILHHA